MGIHKLTISAYRTSENDDVEGVAHTMAQMTLVICNEYQNN